MQFRHCLYVFAFYISTLCQDIHVLTLMVLVHLNEREVYTPIVISWFPLCMNAIALCYGIKIVNVKYRQWWKFENLQVFRMLDFRYCSWWFIANSGNGIPRLLRQTAVVPIYGYSSWFVLARSIAINLPAWSYSVWIEVVRFTNILASTYVIHYV